MLKTTYLILCFFISASAYSGIDPAYYAKPYDYSLNTKSPYDSAMDGWQRGAQMAQQAQNAKQQKELHQIRISQLKREDEYRDELKVISENPENISEETFRKLIIKYPEFSDTTMNLYNSLKKISD